MRAGCNGTILDYRETIHLMRAMQEKEYPGETSQPEWPYADPKNRSQLDDNDGQSSSAGRVDAKKDACRTADFDRAISLFDGGRNSFGDLGRGGSAQPPSGIKDGDEIEAQAAMKVIQARRLGLLLGNVPRPVNHDNHDERNSKAVEDKKDKKASTKEKAERLPHIPRQQGKSPEHQTLTVAAHDGSNAALPIVPINQQISPG
jgi:hypothetical protein